MSVFYGAGIGVPVMVAWYVCGRLPFCHGASRTFCMMVVGVFG